MHLHRLHLQAYGPFTDRWLDFAPRGLTLVHGPNEAGKSSLLRALIALRFGIEHRSSDNFVHDHARMVLGGVFVDAQGVPCHLVRRKGRGQTLTLRTDDGTVQPASAAIEQALTGGLGRGDYETMFGLDHARLRAGGAALVAGEGDVGAALFEASAGLRSVPRVIEALEGSARQLFVPGARGRNGRLNEALRRHDESARACREALLRPAEWAERQRAQAESGEVLRSLLARQTELQRQCERWREWLVVAPLLRRLDEAAAWLAAQGDEPVLDEATERRRVEIQTAQAALTRDLAALQADEAVLQRALAELPAPTTLLPVAPMIDRLAAQGETLDRLAQEIATLVPAWQAALSQRADCAARLDPQAPVEALLARRPAPEDRATIARRLAELDQAERALAQHLAAMAARHDDAGDPAGDTDAIADDTVSDVARAALRSAGEAATAARTVLARLDTLPAERAAWQRQVAEAAVALGLDPARATPRRLLEAEIDLAQRQLDESHALRGDLQQRIREIDVALRRQRAERERLLASGPVPTRDDVLAARGARDALWTRMHAAADGDTAAGAASCEADYLAALRHADALADALAQDTARAARLQELQRALADLAHDRAQRLDDIDRLDATAAARARDWTDRLTAAGLPVLAPTALREWQGRWQAARELAERVDALGGEQAQAEAVAAQVRQGLLAALRTVLRDAMPFDAEAPLSALLALAHQIEAMQARAEQARATRSGVRQAREQQHRRDQAEADRLRSARDAAAQRLAQAAAVLSLAGVPDAVAVRARLDAWGALDEADAAVRHIELQRATCQAERGQIDERAAAVAQALGEGVPADLRHWIDTLVERLARTRALDQQRERLQQSLRDTQARRQQQARALQLQDEALAALCRAAGVDDAAALPAREDRARAIRARRQEHDQAARTLAQASAQAPDVLRAQLGTLDRTALAAELQRGEQALADLAAEVEQARARDEQARRALDALDASDRAAQARERMEGAAASIRADHEPWLRTRVAQALLNRALRSFRERAQGPMLAAASRHFATMTGGEFVRLVGDVDADASRPVLRARRQDGREIGVEAMSEGTRDQLYLALRLAAWGLQRERGLDLPVVLDDVLMTSDDARALRMLGALADFAADAQVLVFTHHRHLLDLARQALPAGRLAIQEL